MKGINKMKPIKLFSFLFLLLPLCSFNFQKKEPVSTLEKSINDFSLRNTDNKIISLSDYKDAKGFMIVFTCNHCPFAKLYPERFNALNLKYQSLGVPLIAINSMDSLLYDDESFELMQQKAKSEKFNFSYLHDADQKVGKDFNAKHTPHAFVIWKMNGSWVIKYSGAIDDNGEHPELATPYISNAVDELLQNKTVTKPETESFGCAIFYRK